MKIQKVASLLAAGVLGLLCLGGCAPDEKKENSFNDRYDVLGLNEIAVGMYVTPDDQHREQKYFDYMSEAGINFVNGFRWFEDTDEEVVKCLDLSQEAGLRFLVNDKSVLANLETYFKTKDPTLIDSSMEQIQKFVDHPAYAGQFFIDEPYRDKLEDLAAFTNMFEECFPNVFWNVNHNPTNVTNLGCTYEQFMDDYFELTNGTVYSYDIYPLIEYDENQPIANRIMEDFLYGLDMVRVKTLEKKVPFWTYVQTIGIGGNGPTRRDPSENDIRWSVFVNLAFGAKGIQYFTYFTPGSGTEEFTSGMIDLQGNKTEHYEAVKKVDAEFQNYGEILLHCDAEGIIFNKQTSNRRYRLYSEKLNSYGNVESVEGDSFIAGCFKHTGTEEQYLLITPPSPFEGAQVRLNMQKLKQTEAYIDGKLQKIEAKNGQIELNIAAGGAVFVKV